MGDGLFEYDAETGVLIWAESGSDPSPVDGVSLAEYQAFVEAIRRARALSAGQIFAQNEEQLDFARRYRDRAARAR